MLLAAFDRGMRMGGSQGPRFIFPLLLLLLLSFLLMRVVRHRRGGGPGMHHHRSSSPIHTLDDRFARGDIDRSEYDHRKAVLEGADFVPPAPPRAAPTESASAPPTVTDDAVEPDASGDADESE